MGAQAGVGAVGLVFDPGEGVDGPDAGDADLGLGVVEVGEPGLEEGPLGDEELFVVRGAVGDVRQDMDCGEDEFGGVIHVSADAGVAAG